MSNDKYKPITCDDYGDRKGCGAEIFLLVDKKFSRPNQKKYKRVEKYKIPTFDDEGNFAFRWVEHAFFCPHSNKLEKHRENQRRKAAEFRNSRNPKDSRSVSRVGDSGSGNSSLDSIDEYIPF